MPVSFCMKQAVSVLECITAMTLIMLIANSSGCVAVLDRQQSLSTLPLYLKPQIVICQDMGSN